MKRILLSLLLLPAIAAMPALAQEKTVIPPQHPAAGEHAVNAGQAMAEEPAGASEREHKVIEFDAPTAVWVLIIFIVLLIILYPTAWKQVLAGLKSREERIRKDISDAEAARAKAELTLRDYNSQLAQAEKKVQDMIASAVAEGEKVATSIKMNAQQEAEAAKERATRDIEASKNQAIAEFNTYAANLATDIASKILRRSLNPEDQKDLVNRSLEQMQTLSKN